MISFLAPKYNAEGDVNDIRKASMQLIASAADYIRPMSREDAALHTR